MLEDVTILQGQARHFKKALQSASAERACRADMPGRHDRIQ